MTGGSGGGFSKSDPVGWVLEHSRAKGSTRLVLVALAASVDYRKCITFPSVHRLMKLTGLSRGRIFWHLQKLCALGDIGKVRCLTNTGATVHHLCKFCEVGSYRGVLIPGLSCAHVQALERLAGGVLKSGYLSKREGASVLNSGLKAGASSPSLAAPQFVIQKARARNGYAKLRGTALLEHNLTVIARAGR